MHSPSDKADKTGLSQLKECYVCLENPVMIHLSRKEMLLSGLFGHLGEENIQLVNMTDTLTLNKFHHLAMISSQQLPFQLWRSKRVQPWPISLVPPSLTRQLTGTQYAHLIVPKKFTTSHSPNL